MIPENVFYSYICHFCKKPNINLKRCTSCKLVAYCSKIHQERDWIIHKKLCRVVHQVNQKIPKTIVRSFTAWHQYMAEKWKRWQVVLKRPLRTDEHQCWMFSRYCAVCYSEDHLTPCDSCLNVSYCSEEHKEKHVTHSKFCAQLKLCMMIDCYLFRSNINHLNPQGNHGMKLCGDSVSCLPLNQVELCNLIIDDKIELNSSNVNDESYVKNIILCDQFAGMATILYTLEKLGLIVDRNLIDSSVLTLHFVGASAMELCMNWTAIFELAFHWIRNLKDIVVLLIGPDICELSIDPQLIFSQMCPYCQENGKIAIINTIKDVYDNVVDFFPKPDLIVMFNCGLHEYQSIPQKDLWKRSLKSLFFHEVPLLLTGYTKREVTLDIQRLKCIKQTLEVKLVQKNPFASMRPFRQCSETSPIFYINGYLAIIV